MSLEGGGRPVDLSYEAMWSLGRSWRQMPKAQAWVLLPWGPWSRRHQPGPGSPAHTHPQPRAGVRACLQPRVTVPCQCDPWGPSSPHSHAGAGAGGRGPPSLLSGSGAPHGGSCGHTPHPSWVRCLSCSCPGVPAAHLAQGLPWVSRRQTPDHPQPCSYPSPALTPALL